MNNRNQDSFVHWKETIFFLLPYNTGITGNILFSGLVKSEHLQYFHWKRWKYLSWIESMYKVVCIIHTITIGMFIDGAFFIYPFGYVYEICHKRWYWTFQNGRISTNYILFDYFSIVKLIHHYKKSENIERTFHNKRHTQPHVLNNKLKTNEIGLWLVHSHALCNIDQRAVSIGNAVHITTTQNSCV